MGGRSGFEPLESTKHKIDMGKCINGYFQVTDQDIDRAIRATGAEHHYVFGGFDHVYTSKPLTEEQKDEYEARAQETLRQGAKEIAKEIDKRILEELMDKHPGIV